MKTNGQAVREGLLPPSIEWHIKRMANVHLQGPQPNIFTFSTPRSGSTWLMEMIATQPWMKLIDEPLLVTRFTEDRGPLPPDWKFLLPGPERETVLADYFSNLLKNKTGLASPRPFHRFHRWVTRRVVFKILRCKDLMNWFEERFQAKIVYLVRHPLPTSLSRSTYDRTELFLAHDDYCNRFLGPELRGYARSLFEHGTELEKKTLDWCLQNLPPLKFLDRSRWCCLHYEDLVLDPAAAIERLAEELDLTHPDRMRRRQSVASGSSVQSDEATRRYLADAANGDRSYLVNRWRSRVSEEDEQRVFDILERFQIDTYSFGEDLPTHRA